MFLMLRLKIAWKIVDFIRGVENVKKKNNIQSIRNVTLIGQLGDIIAYKQGLWTVIVPASSHCSALQGMSTLSEEEL